MGSRKKLIAGNWKMYKTCTEAVDSVKDLDRRTKDITDPDIMIAPPFTALWPVAEALKNSRIRVGAQNLFWEKEGAFTGEISPAMLVSAGCRYVIIGHSERRQYFGETDESVNKKIRAAIENTLIPILCIGESQEQRAAGETFSVLDKQVQKGLEGFSLTDLKNLVVAYEPVWAIGTGQTATTDQAQEAHQYIRSRIASRFDKELANSMRILYGGSVKPDNAAALMAMPDLDGALVGGASLDAETFSRIVRFKSYGA